jgi:uncharacterized RDD family membrane protein YckC
MMDEPMLAAQGRVRIAGRHNATMTEAAPPPAVAPATGLVYGDVPNRIIAYIIDAIVIFIINIVVAIPLGIIGITAMSGLATNWIGSIIIAAFSLAVSGIYFVYLWTRRRATLGMQVLNLQIGTAPGGETITQDQAIKRWLALGAIFTIAQVLNPLPLVGILIAFLSLGWVIFLLVTTAQSPTKQGWHDKFANTQIVKAAKSVG